MRFCPLHPRSTKPRAYSNVKCGLWATIFELYTVNLGDYWMAVKKFRNLSLIVVI